MRCLDTKFGTEVRKPCTAVDLSDSWCEHSSMHGETIDILDIAYFIVSRNIYDVPNICNTNPGCYEEGHKTRSCQPKCSLFSILVFPHDPHHFRLQLQSVYFLFLIVFAYFSAKASSTFFSKRPYSSAFETNKTYSI